MYLFFLTIIIPNIIFPESVCLYLPSRTFMIFFKTVTEFGIYEDFAIKVAILSLSFCSVSWKTYKEKPSLPSNDRNNTAWGDWYI